MQIHKRTIDRTWLKRYGACTFCACALLTQVVSADDVKAPLAAPPSVLVPVPSIAAPTPMNIAGPEKQSIDEAHVPSLFYSAEEMAALRDALALYTNTSAGKPGDMTGGIPHLEGKKTLTAPTKTYTYPQFFLESLEYHTPKEWVVHINGMKITPDAPHRSDIRVVALDKDEVSFEWTPTDMAKVHESWQKATKSSGVSVDERSSKVNFTLRHNQTFSAYLMRVLEGKVEPVVIQNTITAPSDAVRSSSNAMSPDKSPSYPAPGAGTPPGPDTSPHHEGLEGLMDAYKSKKLENPTP